MAEPPRGDTALEPAVHGWEPRTATVTALWGAKEIREIEGRGERGAGKGRERQGERGQEKRKGWEKGGEGKAKLGGEMKAEEKEKREGKAGVRRRKRESGGSWHTASAFAAFHK